MGKTVELNDVLEAVKYRIDEEKNEKVDKLIDKIDIDIYKFQEEKGQLSLQDILLYLKLFSVGMKQI